jgi:hypothetical protein
MACIQATSLGAMGWQWGKSEPNSFILYFSCTILYFPSLYVYLHPMYMKKDVIFISSEYIQLIIPLYMFWDEYSIVLLPNMKCPYNYLLHSFQWRPRQLGNGARLLLLRVMMKAHHQMGAPPRRLTKKRYSHRGRRRELVERKMMIRTLI